MSDLCHVKGWKRISQMVIARDGGVCHICGQGGATTADHIIPRSAGGDHSMGNLRAAHRSCNAKRGGVRLGRASLPRAVSRW